MGTLSRTAIVLGCSFLLLLGAIPHTVRAETTLAVDSTAARFSPGNWAGDEGRGGSKFRRTWNSGAWCEWKWTTPAEHPAAKILVGNATAGSAVSWFLDGVLTENVPVPPQGGIAVSGLANRGEHSLLLFTASSQQVARWDGSNAFTVTGLAVDDGATAHPATPARPWVLIIGDSITEGIGAGSSLGDYAFLVGLGLHLRGYDTSVSACGYSGWIRPGDGSGDVPPYYAVRGGAYDESASRWNRIDGRTSLLDPAGHLSGQGGVDQEPAAILINYIVNETLSNASVADAKASVTGCLAALRKASPKTAIVVLVPPGLEDTKVYPKAGPYLAALRDGFAEYQKAHAEDQRTYLVDFGPEVARALGSQPFGGGVHPNAAGHAYLAPMVLERLLDLVGDPAKK